MTPDWLNEIVRAFGRQMNLTRFELNERGAAGVRFENGLSFRLEYARESLMVMAGVPVPPDAEALKRLLVSVHPSAVRSHPMRAAYLAKTGEAVFICRLDEREASVTSLESVFRLLWGAADQLRRAQA